MGNFRNIREFFTADQTWVKQRLFSGWIKPARNDGIAVGATHRGGKAGAGQFLEALLGLQEGLGIPGIEVVPAVAGVVHHYLGSHC